MTNPDFHRSAASEQDYLEDNVGTVAFHLGRPGARLSVSDDNGLLLLVDPGEVLKEVSRRLTTAPAQAVEVWGPTQEDVVAHAIMLDDGCGLTVNGQRVLCDDPRAMEQPERCYCRRSARAALTALAAQRPAAPVETATKSAPVLGPPQNNAERLPTREEAGAGAGTQCSAGNGGEK